MNEQVDLFSIIGQLYVNLLAAQNTNKRLQEQLEAANEPPTQEKKEVEQATPTRDPVPL